MVGPKCPFLRINRDDGEGEVRALSGFDDHVFVKHGGRQITGAILEHFMSEKAGRFSVVDDRFFDGLNVVAGLFRSDILGGES